MADLAGGAARRRRERRLRSWLRHERMTVRMELAAALHIQQGLRRTTLYAARRQSALVVCGQESYRILRRSWLWSTRLARAPGLLFSPSRVWVVAQTAWTSQPRGGREEDEGGAATEA